MDDDIANVSDVALKCCEVLTLGMNDDFEIILRF